MIVERICFEKLYPTGVYANVRLRAEAIVGEEDSLVECYKQLGKMVDDAFEAMNPQINWNESSQKENHIVNVNDMVSEPISKDEKLEGMKQLLSLCNTKQLLERQRGQVERLANKEVSELFESKLKSFQ